MEIVYEGNLRRLKKQTIFKTKWVERYFVLYCRDSSRSLYSIDEYKDKRKQHLKKSFKLEFVNRIESNLSIADHSISCSSGSPALNWIFSIGFRFQGIQKDLYLVAPNDEEMNKWIREVCQVCKLHRQFDDPYQNFVTYNEDNEIATTSLSDRSISSQTLETSSDFHNLTDQTTDNRMQMFNFGKKKKKINEKISIISSRSLPRETNYSNISEKQETFSDTSSICSSRKNMTSTVTTEEDVRSTSSSSAVPIPPPRSKHSHHKSIGVSKLNRTPASLSMGLITVDDNDSSGETLKNVQHVPPPPIDRSNKPKNLRADEDRTRYRNVSKNIENHYTYSRTTKTESKRRNFDYFEPSTENLAFSNTRSPTPSDIEYITVDVDRTLAFQQMSRMD